MLKTCQFIICKLCDPSLSNFDESTEIDLQNGLNLNSTYLPDEVALQILLHVEPKEVLKCSLVCHQWNRLIKSYPYWSTVYKRHYKQREPKKLPWYVYYCLFSTEYFDTNLIKEKRDLEDKPLIIARPGCFGVSHEINWRRQTVSLQNNKLFNHIVNCYKPHIYLSEWAAPRDDCSGCLYKLSCIFRKENSDIDFPDPPCAVDFLHYSPKKQWKKIELIVKEYPEQVDEISFEHDGRSDEFWDQRNLVYKSCVTFYLQ